MKQETLKTLADGSLILTVGTGAGSKALSMFEYINTYAAGIGALISLAGLIIATIFYLATWRKQNLSNENKQELDLLSSAFDSHKEDTQKEFEKVGGGIQEILTKLDNSNQRQHKG